MKKIMNIDSPALEAMSRQELSRLFPIILVKYDPEWPFRYEQEAADIQRSIPANNWYRIRHFGSTSVPGLDAKPTIDILLEIHIGSDLDSIIEIFKNRSYYYSPQPENPAPHMMFMKGYTPDGFSGQAFHVHVRYPGDWDEIYFRDFLRIHPETAAEYASLKHQLKNQFEYDRDGYTHAKSDFIQHYTKIAKENIKNLSAKYSDGQQSDC
jgi:GrpB-like predicted nucleotidyltransferase (UPF0157 family)